MAEDPDLCGRLMGEQIREANDEALQTLLGKGERKQTEEKNFEGIKRRSSRLKKI